MPWAMVVLPRWGGRMEEREFFGVGAAIGEDFAFAEELEHGVGAEGFGLPCRHNALQLLRSESFDPEVGI